MRTRHPNGFAQNFGNGNSIGSLDLHNAMAGDVVSARLKFYTASSRPNLDSSSGDLQLMSLGPIEIDALQVSDASSRRVATQARGDLPNEPRVVLFSRCVQCLSAR